MLAVFAQFTKPFSCRFVGMLCLLAGSAGLALACDTPVYRYAMYRWEPAPYEVYYFHDKPLDEQASQVQKLVEAAAQSEEKPANLFFVAVSLTDDPELKKIPPDVRKVWQDQQDRPVPSYMVVTPHGRKLYQGALDEPILKAMLASPARNEVAKQLADGAAGVLIQLSGSDAAANDAAEKVTKELIADVGAGKIELYLPPGMGEMGEAGEENANPGLQLGFTKIARTDPAEKWLIDSLLSMEDDLTNDEYAGQPMIFAVFGRGRALPPFVGKGITRENLLECVYFLTGACSCTVKDQNPGMDLLFAENWWTVAEKLASMFGAEEGNETQLGAAQLFPHLMIPGGQVDSEASKEPAGPVESPNAESPNEAQPPVEPPAASANGAAKAETESVKPESAPGQPQDQAKAHPETPPAEMPDTEKIQAEEPQAKTEPEGQTQPAASQPVQTPAPPAAEHPAHADSAHGADHPEAAAADAIGVFAVGAGLCVALVLLFGLTFLVMRPK
ncbi:MAG: hypothetical protein MUE50_12410 [Pirellulaceae bacterium]|jgi:hypothetical protein|nr:hypothetical protein [Pirellulaceae bacterium]MCU0977768.1 hypothetical protein [Pirellulaceae bacterium]